MADDGAAGYQGASMPPCWIESVLGLLHAATQQLETSKEAAQSTIEQATSLLQEKIRTHPRQRAPAPARLLAWQVRKIRDHVEAHIASRVLVSDLSALVNLSEGHFSRAFKRTFGLSPHAFVLRRRLELAAQLMLESRESLAEIALRCGFVDQAHLCNHFRRAMGQTPAAWRRTHRPPSAGYSAWADCPVPPVRTRVRVK